MKGAAAVTLVLSLLSLGRTSVCVSADWTLSDPQLERLGTGVILAEGDLAGDRTAADVRAAVQIHAPPAQVFSTLIDCVEALHFVPHLKHCTVLETAPDGSWQNVEQQVDYGWLMPRATYVFHAEYERFDRIRFSNVRGDFRENRGEWTFRSLDEGRSTLVIYQARLVPAFYVPRWMMRNMLKRDLPDLMRGLRTHSEAAGAAPATNAPAAASP